MITKREAKKMGKDAGINAARWMFDGNTTKKTFTAVVKGLEGGDPEVLDRYSPPSWTSGENAGESLNELLGHPENKRDENRQQDVADTYAEAADTAFYRELERLARTGAAS